MYNKLLRINYRVMKNVYVFKEGFVYPFVNFGIRKNFYFIRNNDYCGILFYVQHFEMSAL